MIEKPNIDFVIPWVSGNDQKHRDKRIHFAKEWATESEEDVEQTTGEQRFVEHQELKYCLRSIVNNAPWYNTIYLITDEQTPAFLHAERLAIDRIKIIDHKTLFADTPEFLPTFNTRSILTNVDKIPDLAEIVVIGNDDTFIAKEIPQSFFLNDNTLNIYGEFVRMDDPRFQTLHFDALKHSSRILAPDTAEYLTLSHGFMPLFLSSIRECRRRYSQHFENNIRHKFRHRSQFLIEALVSHFILKANQGCLKDTKEMVHFSFQLCREGGEEKLKFLFSLLETGQRTMFCLNDYEALKGRFDWVETQLDNICGAPIASERAD